jgi:hypothetical protein
MNNEAHQILSKPQSAPTALYSNGDSAVNNAPSSGKLEIRVGSVIE